MNNNSHLNMQEGSINISSKSKENKVQKFLSTINKHTLDKINEFINIQSNNSSAQQTTASFTLYKDMLMIRLFKQYQKQLLGRSKSVVEICKEIKQKLHLPFKAQTIRERIQRKFVNITVEDMMFHLENNCNFSFDYQRNLIRPHIPQPAEQRQKEQIEKYIRKVIEQKMMKSSFLLKKVNYKNPFFRNNNIQGKQQFKQTINSQISGERKGGTNKNNDFTKFEVQANDSLIFIVQEGNEFKIQKKIQYNKQWSVAKHNKRLNKYSYPNQIRKNSNQDTRQVFYSSDQSQQYFTKEENQSQKQIFYSDEQNLTQQSFVSRNFAKPGSMKKEWKYYEN